MRCRLAVLLMAIGISPFLGGQSAEITADISYIAGAEGLAAAGDSSQATIIDLRHCAPEGLVSTARIAEPGLLRIILVGGHHAVTWCDILSPRAANVLIIGPVGSEAALDLTVKMDDAAITAALRALAEDSSPAELALPAIHKERFDETTLVQRHQRDNNPADDIDDSAVEDDPDTAKAVVTDVMLERAVQLIQGLRALKRA